MDDMGARQPIPPQEGQAGPPPVKPIPTNVNWGVQKVGHVQETGEPLLMVKFWMVTGEVVLFLPASGAQKLADLLFAHASGIHLAPGGQLT